MNEAKKLRLESGMTQPEWAAKCGLSFHAVVSIELGRCKFTAKARYKMLRFANPSEAEAMVESRVKAFRKSLLNRWNA